MELGNLQDGQMPAEECAHSHICALWPPGCTALENALLSGVSLGNWASVTEVSAEGLGGSRWSRASNHLTLRTSQHPLLPKGAKGKG